MRTHKLETQGTNRKEVNEEEESHHNYTIDL